MSVCSWNFLFKVFISLVPMPCLWFRDFQIKF
jgi:hypothetical protein